MKRRFTERQTVGFLREADGGVPVKELCRKHGFSDGTYHLWRSKFGGMSVSDAKRLKELELENGQLKKLLADALLEDEVTHHSPLIAFINTSWTFIARSHAASGYDIEPSALCVGYPRRQPKGGQITCSREQLDHVLPTLLLTSP